MSKELNELCATKVMGWHKAGHALSGPYWEGANFIIERSKWRPATIFDDAETVLNKALNGRTYEVRFSGGLYDCITNPINEFDFQYPKALKFETLPLAMCVCALRAAGVNDEEIEKALP